MTKIMHKQKWELQKLFIMIQLVLSPIIGVYLIHLRGWDHLKPSRICNTSLDIVGMIILILLFITCVKDRDDLSFRTGCFTYLISLNSWGFLADLVCWVVDENPNLIRVNMLANEAFYLIGVAVNMIFWLYLVEVSESEHPMLPWMTKILNVTGAITFLATFCNYWGRYYFSVDENGVYARGKYFLTSQSFMLIMLVCFILMITRMNIARGKKLALSSFVFCPVFTNIIQINVYGISITQVGILSALILIYGNVFAEQHKELILEKVKNMEKEREIFLAKRERERLEIELNLASEIQTHVLPRVFPAFPDMEEFKLYASMTPAKQVGGDFYDFFQVDEDHIALVIADVSGKGIPAALYMMIAKTLLKNAVKQGLSPKEVMALVNEQLCEGVEDVAMFVTAWIGIMEVKTGKFVASNAGHEYPAIRRKDGYFELMKDRHGLVLGGMEGVRYREYEFQLDPGDTLFVYTDGVPEAINLEEELFGTENMLKALNEMPHAEPDQLLSNVIGHIRSFAGEEPQFDDITMLAVQMSDEERRMEG